MERKIVRKLFLGFVSIHILYHAKNEPIYGSWMIEELKNHGYNLSAGTLYPLLHSLKKEGLLSCIEHNVDGKIRKYYTATTEGIEVLNEARNKAYELFKEIQNNSPEKS